MKRIDYSSYPLTVTETTTMPCPDLDLGLTQPGLYPDKQLTVFTFGRDDFRRDCDNLVRIPLEGYNAQESAYIISRHLAENLGDHPGIHAVAFSPRVARYVFIQADSILSVRELLPNPQLVEEYCTLPPYAAALDEYASYRAELGRWVRVLAPDAQGEQAIVYGIVEKVNRRTNYVKVCVVPRVGNLFSPMDETAIRTHFHPRPHRGIQRGANGVITCYPLWGPPIRVFQYGLEFVDVHVRKLLAPNAKPPPDIERMFRQALRHSYPTLWQLAKRYSRSFMPRSNTVETFCKFTNGSLAGVGGLVLPSPPTPAGKLRVRVGDGVESRIVHAYPGDLVYDLQIGDEVEGVTMNGVSVTGFISSEAYNTPDGVSRRQIAQTNTPSYGPAHDSSSQGLGTNHGGPGKLLFNIQPDFPSQRTQDRPGHVTFVPPPPMTVERAPIQPIRLSSLKTRKPATPYARSSSKNKRNRPGHKEEPVSPTPGSSTNKNPFAVLDKAWPRRLKAEPTLCPTVCPTCLQPMPMSTEKKIEDRSVADVATSMTSTLSLSNDGN
ncbi:hypothetical protein MD484_g8824, partial [Candolleomyces efflorescens]